MKRIAIITARSGSKRIPKKNIKEFMGKPMLAYAIEAALEAGIFDEVMVSTDSAEIADIAKKYGAEVPFMRSEKTSNDFATTAEVLTEVIEEYNKRGITFDEFCCIYPCVPFLTGQILKNAYGVFAEKQVDRLIPVVKFSFPIQRALRVNGKGFLEFREPENAPKRSQDLEAMYHDVGMFYFYKTGRMQGDRIAAYEMDERSVQDIDTMDDWKMAEIKYKLLKNEEN